MKFRIEVYQAGNGWTWHKLRIRGGRIVATSHESFDTRSNAIRAAKAEIAALVPGIAELWITDAL